MKEFIAKSNGENIFLHTDKVVENIKILCKKYGISDEDTEILIYAAILHDIGKMIKKTQDFFHQCKEVKFKFSHNIIGWYFITKYVNIKNKEKVANLVLWHHANYSSCSELSNKLSDIRKELSNEDIKNIKEVFCQHYNIPTFEEECEDDYLDNEFYRVDNLLRSILVTSDVCASSGENILTLFQQETIDFSSLNESFTNSDRTKKQFKVVEKIQPQDTTSINAPTGFGKSIIAILFAMIQDKTTLLVCPTNIIASSIYSDIIKILKMMGLDMSVELYLTGGAVKESNTNLGEFKSKLVITNIDSFIKPSVSNSYGSRCLMIYECAVIFDESHEYDDMDCALNACYNNIMNLRHNVLGSTTLNLTATPVPSRFIRAGGKNINYLPSKYEHYEAAHEQKYCLIFHDTIPTHLMHGEFIFFGHVIDEVQDFYLDYNGKKLIAHGAYVDKDKEIKKNLVLNNYAKDGPRQEHAVFTNQILTTSCDYSVAKMFIKCPTIRGFFQSMGRVNRFGNLGDCDVHIILEKSKADEIHIGSEDDNELQRLFIYELKKQSSNNKVTLNELYKFYNKFSEKYKDLINSISRQNLIDSKNMLKYIFPKKTKENKTGIKIANSNKIRQSLISDGIFISAKLKNTDEYITMSYNVNKKMGFTKTFKEDENTYRKQVKQVKKRDNFNKHKKITPELMIKEAIFYDTPYVVYSHEYCLEIGLRKNKK